MNTASIVQKLWNYCNGPRLGRSLAGSPAREHTGVHEKPRFTLRDDGMSYGDALFDHYRHTLEELGKQKGLFGLIFAKSHGYPT